MRFGRGGGDRTRPPNYKVPWNDGVAAPRQIQLLILLNDFKTEDLGYVAVGQLKRSVNVEAKRESRDLNHRPPDPEPTSKKSLRHSPGVSYGI